MNQYLRIHSKDNIVVALQDLPKGLEINIDDDQFRLAENIGAKHKFAMRDMHVGDTIFMYGVLVGTVTEKIVRGSAITIKNVKHASAAFSGSSGQFQWQKPATTKFEGRTFKGYHRANGEVGTANNWLVIPLVFCENRNVDVIEEALVGALGYKTKKDFSVDTHLLVKKYQEGASKEELEAIDLTNSSKEYSQNRVFPNVDGLKFLRHQGGCGGTREDAEMLCKLLAGYIVHPNTAGATILSLGCQNAQIPILKKYIEEKNPNFDKPLYFLEQQQSKNERDFIGEAVKKTFIGLTIANKIERNPAPLNKLVLGLECGASDGFSGISANPSLGHASDLLVALGGTAVLAEFPELNGVEQELINRCESPNDAKKFETLMRTYSNAAIAVGSGFENNPSPGNIKDGLITDAMKSAGAAKKGGTSAVTAVLDYAEMVTKPGLNLLCTPGNDVESTTGLAGSGCNLIVFTTGLGTPTGNPLVPVVKLSSNDSLSRSMEDIIDINAGGVIRGEETIESMGEKIMEHLIKVASGEFMTKADINGQNDFIPWKRGISL
ncbi:UxaA family hydrolase [Croceitalea marina]|uniref:UxaA family hydrolase n=1 Tax=Croceitalea marina TaxID=1775166 RepID=A0ABW5MY73_9FLAO